MKPLLAVALVTSLGCGAIFNGNTATLSLPPGTVVDGAQVNGPIIVSKQQPHQVIFPDGRQCVLESNLSVLYLIGDILTFPLGLIIDAVTNDWKVLTPGLCGGVMIM